MVMEYVETVGVKAPVVGSVLVFDSSRIRELDPNNKVLENFQISKATYIHSSRK